MKTILVAVLPVLAVTATVHYFNPALVKSDWWWPIAIGMGLVVGLAARVLDDAED